jgi:hypothetical protein
MVSLSNTKSWLLVYLLIWGVIFNINQFGQNEDLEKNISKALAKEVRCKNIIVKAKVDNSKNIDNLAIRIEEVEIGGIIADYITIQLKKPVLDDKSFKEKGKFRLVTSSEKKINILLSTNSLQKYLAMKAKEFGKNNVNIKLKFSAPYIECFYDVPKNEIASETFNMLSSFIPGDKLEGYSAFLLKINKNKLSAHSSKVILNHFLLPTSIISVFEKKFNPFDEIVPLSIIDFKINNINVQSKYVLLSN